MGKIERLTESDIAQVANLFMRVFRKSSSPAPASLLRYFGDLYLKNPWYDERVSSSVYKSDDGSVTGFLGVIPRPMTFNGRTITAAVGGNHMVDPERKDPLAGALLLRSLFAGPQELTLTDTANAISKKLWERSGAVTLLSRSLRWIKVLRPFQFGLSYALRAPGVRWLNPIDSLFRNNRLFQRTESRLKDEENPSLELLINSGKQAPDRLEPFYTKESLRWLLDQARQKQEHGEFHLTAHSGEEGFRGWSAFYAHAGRTAQVLRISASRASYGEILDAVIAKASRLGASAIMGDVDPLHTEELLDRECFIFLRRPYTMAYSRDPEIIRALESNRATLSRLEGEWWTRLQGDTFTPSPS